MASETTFYTTTSQKLKVCDLPFYGFDEVEIFADYRHDVELHKAVCELKNVDCFDYLDISLCDLEMLKLKEIYRLDEFRSVIDELISSMKENKSLRVIVGYC